MLDEKTKAEIAEINDGLGKIQLWVIGDEYAEIEKTVLRNYKEFKKGAYARELEKALEQKK